MLAYVPAVLAACANATLQVTQRAAQPDTAVLNATAPGPAKTKLAGARGPAP